MSNEAKQDNSTLAELEEAKTYHNTTVHRTANPRVSWHNCGVCITMDLRIKAARGASKAAALESMTDAELIGLAAESASANEPPPVIEEIPLHPLVFPTPLPAQVYCTEEDFRTLRPTDRPGKFRRSRLSPKEGAARITAWMQCGGDRHMIIERFGFDRYQAIYGTAYTYRSALPREVWRPGWEKHPEMGLKTGGQGGGPIRPVFDIPNSDAATPEQSESIASEETEFERELASLRTQLAAEHERADAAAAELARLRRPFIARRVARSIWKRLRAVARAIAKGE